MKPLPPKVEPTTRQDLPDLAQTRRPPATARRPALIALTIPLALAFGCGPTAYKITPVPVDRTLDEKTLIHEGGLVPAKIALVDVEGILMNRNKPSLLAEGEHPVSLFVEKLDKAARDKSVRALVLRINSPGGTVTASDLMHRELLHFKQRTGRPVVAVLMDVAASGGYYVACGADEIVASPTTVTGSVGVIMQMFDLARTLEMIGVSTDAITSGRMKDAGSPLRKMRPEEREIFQSLVDEFYDQFIRVVAAGRPGLDEEQVREVADGRVYSATQALELGFVDRVGTLRDALAGVKHRLGVKRVRVVTYHRPLGWKPNLYAASPAGQPQLNLVNLQIPEDWPYPTAQFLYLWVPGRS